MIGKQQKLLQRILPLFLFGTLWSLLIKHLSVRWAINPQYSFGWFVPLISAYLFLIRWRSRPAVEFAHSAVAKWFFCTAGFALLPTWLVKQPNPDWRLISWLLAFEIVALSLCAIYFVGGRSWLRHFGFSICFILVSVPWPSAVEDFVIQGLTQAAAAFSTAGERQQKAPDEKTRASLEHFSGDPDVEKARAKSEHPQEIEETFHKNFDGIGLG